MDFDFSPCCRIILKTLAEGLQISVIVLIIFVGTPLSEMIRILLCPLRRGARFFFETACLLITILYLSLLYLRQDLSYELNFFHQLKLLISLFQILYQFRYLLDCLIYQHRQSHMQQCHML